MLSQNSYLYIFFLFNFLLQKVLPYFVIYKENCLLYNKQNNEFALKNSTVKYSGVITLDEVIKPSDNIKHNYKIMW